MPLNPVKGNMYSWITHTFNTIKGKCPHSCYYCYMKRFGNQKPIRIDESELKTDLGTGNFIFVGSSNDMWADAIPQAWIDRTIEHCCQFKNKYLFQTKNPGRIESYIEWLPEDSVIGTTIESNRHYWQMGNAPYTTIRAERMAIIRGCGFPNDLMVTVEPIMDFDLHVMIEMISRIEPEWVNIGADSGGHKLPEPSKEKVLEFISELKKFTEVILKKNLNRLLK